uniref:Uncharacterized protein n=1 Tax=Nelumbo nucifera TaxID=4432 RepID=A0A822ZGG5_NELNU|nr:TPA_asm: hypothetical protein HUJ06_003454 [Nelumbo nucifera]
MGFSRFHQGKKEHLACGGCKIIEIYDKLIDYALVS